MKKNKYVNKPVTFESEKVLKTFVSMILAAMKLATNKDDNTGIYTPEFYAEVDNIIAQMIAKKLCSIGSL